VRKKVNAFRLRLDYEIPLDKFFLLLLLRMAIGLKVTPFEIEVITDAPGTYALRGCR
jgi:hypothetical protein